MTARAGEKGREMNFTATIQDPPHTSPSSSASTKKSPAGCGRTSCLPCPDRRSGHSGAPCSRSSILSLCCRLSSILRRRWWNSCRTSSPISSTFQFRGGRGGSGSGGGGGPLGFLQGQNPAALFEQNVDIPVPRGGHDLHLDPGSAASSAVSRDEAFQVFFSHFSPISKKCAVRQESESEGARSSS